MTAVCADCTVLMVHSLGIGVGAGVGTGVGTGVGADSVKASEDESPAAVLAVIDMTVGAMVATDKTDRPVIDSGVERRRAVGFAIDVQFLVRNYRIQNGGRCCCAADHWPHSVRHRRVRYCSPEAHYTDHY
jgi:hypothetical protein